MVKTERNWYCDFCEKPAHEVLKLVAGANGVAICNECIVVAGQVCLGTYVEPEEEPTI